MTYNWNGFWDKTESYLVIIPNFRYKTVISLVADSTTLKGTTVTSQFYIIWWGCVNYKSFPMFQTLGKFKPSLGPETNLYFPTDLLVACCEFRIFAKLIPKLAMLTLRAHYEPLNSNQPENSVCVMEFLFFFRNVFVLWLSGYVWYDALNIVRRMVIFLGKNAAPHSTLKVSDEICSPKRNILLSCVKEFANKEMFIWRSVKSFFDLQQ